VIEWVLVHVDLSPLMLLAIGLVVYGVVRRWVERRLRARALRVGPSVADESSASTVSVDPSGSSAVDENPGAPTRLWWQDPVGIVPVTVGLVMIVGHGAVERAFGAVVSIAASLFLPTR